MRKIDAFQALSAVVTEQRPSGDRTDTYRIDTLLVESILARPEKPSGFHVAYIERALGRSLPPREYPVRDVMKRYRMWMREIREPGAASARRTAEAICAALMGGQPSTQGTLFDGDAELLAWSGKAVLLLVASTCRPQLHEPQEQVEIQVLDLLRETVTSLSLSNCNTLLRTVMNLLAPKRDVSSSDAEWLETQLHIAQAQVEAWRKTNEETERSALDHAVLDLVRDMNSEDSRYLLDQLLLLDNIRDRFTQQGGKLPPGFAAIFTTGKAVVRYLQRKGIEPFGEVGRTFTLTDTDIDEDAFELHGEEFLPGEERLVRITGPGWRHRGEVIMPPKVEKVEEHV